MPDDPGLPNQTETKPIFLDAREIIELARGLVDEAGEATLNPGSPKALVAEQAIAGIVRSDDAWKDFASE